MKKAFLAVITVFLSLALFSCFFTAPDTPDNEPMQYTADGRPLVNLTIGTSRTRSLTDAQAKNGGITYYEVAFYDNTTGSEAYYRTSWRFDQKGKLRVPPGDYRPAGRAILFAGYEKNGEYTLLAVGLLTKVGGTTADATNKITITTKEVTFTLMPILSNIEAHPTDSTFQITGLPTALANPAAAEYDLTADIAPGDFPTAPPSVYKKPVPLYLIPKNVTGGTDDKIEASFKITMPTVVSPLTGDFADYQPGIYALGTGTAYPEWISGGFGTFANITATVSNVTADAVLNLSDGGTPTPAYRFTFNIITPADDFYCKLYFKVPVCPISDDATADGEAPLTWYIQGGLENHLLDENEVNEKSTGGALLLGVGNINYITVNGEHRP